MRNYFELINDEVLEISETRFEETKNPAYSVGGTWSCKIILKNCNFDEDYNANYKQFIVTTSDWFIIHLKESNENFRLAVKYSQMSKAEIDNITLKKENEELKSKLIQAQKDASEVATLKEKLHLAEEHILMLKFLVKQSRKNLSEKQIWVEDEDGNKIDAIWHLKSKSKEKECIENGWFHLGDVIDYINEDYTFYNPYNI